MYLGGWGRKCWGGGGSATRPQPMDAATPFRPNLTEPDIQSAPHPRCTALVSQFPAADLPNALAAERRPVRQPNLRKTQYQHARRTRCQDAKNFSEFAPTSFDPTIPRPPREGESGVSIPPTRCTCLGEKAGSSTWQAFKPCISSSLNRTLAIWAPPPGRLPRADQIQLLLLLCR